MSRKKLNKDVIEYFKDAETKYPSGVKVSSEVLDPYCFLYTEFTFCDESQKKLEPFSEVVPKPEPKPKIKIKDNKTQTKDTTNN